MKQAPWIIAAFALLVCCAAFADDWPQYRGPNRDGVWKETGILDKFPADGLKIQWRAPIGKGFSSPVIAGGRVYVTDSLFANPRADERVLCFDEATGKLLWTFVNNVAYPDWAFVEKQGSGPTSTPIMQDGMVYAIGNRGDLVCLDALSGKVLWRINLEADFHVQEFSFNISPLIDGDLLFMSLGSFPHPEVSCVIALDRKTGKLAWKVAHDGLTNSSPIVIQAAGKKQLIFWVKESVIALDPATGNLLWKVANNIGSAYASATPVLQGERLLIGGLMLRLQNDQPGATVLWPQTKGSRGEVLSNTSTPAIDGDYVYSARTSGQLICMDATTGEVVWENTTVTDQQSGSSIHLTPSGDRTFLFTDQGDLILAQLSPKGYTEISRARLIEPTFPFGGKNRAWPPAAFANHHVFARSDKELVCASLAADSR